MTPPRTLPPRVATGRATASPPPLAAALVAALAAAVLGVGLALAANPPLEPGAGAANAPAGLGLGADGAPAAPGAAPASANPLWGIPLAALTATRERPLFLPSRRPPAPAVAAAPPAEPVRPPPPPAEPEQPPLSLVGIVSGAGEGYAVFISTATRDTVRLRTGEGHEGWILTAVKGREAVLEKNRHSAVLALPLPAGDQR